MQNEQLTNKIKCLLAFSDDNTCSTCMTHHIESVFPSRIAI